MHYANILKIVAVCCDAVLCVAYAVQAFKQADKTDRKWSIIISCCFGLAAISKTLGSLGV